MLINFKNREAFLKTCREFYFELVELDVEANSGDAASASPPLIEHGKIRREFARFLKPLFNEEFGDNGKNLATLTEAELKERLNNLNAKVREYPMKEGNLVDYSPWLKNFKRNPAKDLEIPGIYFLVSWKTK